MPIMMPPYLGEEVKSSAERKVFEALREIEMEECYILHSLGLPRHQHKIYGEIDFVIVCKRGVACLEIKGGRIECRSGVWVFIDRYGVEHQKTEGPFAQVAGNMFSLMTQLKSKFTHMPRMKNALIACGVIFPDIVFRSTSQEVISEIVYDAESVDMDKYINQIFDYWEQRHHRDSSKLTPGEVKEIVNYLRGEFTFIPTLKNRLDTVEQRLVRLTSEQTQIMNALSTNSHLLIEGKAGTGKTLLAVDFARRRALNGDKVLYLTFNKNLANRIAMDLSEFETVKVINLHALFGEYVSVDPAEIKKNQTEYFSERLPELFFDYLVHSSEDEISMMQYDLIIMDEGQDIVRPAYLYPLDILLKNGFEKGDWAIFYDEKQNIYNPEYADGMQFIEAYSVTKFKLYVNCRNTVQIGTYSSEVSGIEMKEFLKENGEEVRKISFSVETDSGDTDVSKTDLSLSKMDTSEPMKEGNHVAGKTEVGAGFKQQIKRIMNELRAEKIALSDITFLSHKKYQKSLLSKIGIEVNDVSDSKEISADLPNFSTIHGFKGLDSKIIILVDVDEIPKSFFSKFLYIAGTRARTLLYIVASDRYWMTHM